MKLILLLCGWQSVLAGAHTVQANHFLVESIWARRHFAKPRIVHVLGVEPWTSNSSIVTVELVSVTAAPALEVQIEISPQPTDRSLNFPPRTKLIDGSHSFAFRFEIPNTGFKAQLSVGYDDQIGTRYIYDAQLDSEICIPHWHRGQNQLDEIREALVEINRSLQQRR